MPRKKAKEAQAVAPAGSIPVEAPNRANLRARFLTLCAEAQALKDVGVWVNGIEVQGVRNALIAEHKAELAEVVEALAG